MSGLGDDTTTNAGDVGASGPVTASSAVAAAHFDEVYATYAPILRGIAVRKFAIPRVEADDLVQDVFASYLANRSRVRDYEPYLIGAICNAARQYRRRDDASPFSPRPEHRECGQTGRDEVIDGVIRNLVIRTTLARLGRSCRETLERFYLRGETAVVIAEQRQTTANYIWRLLNYCRNRARSIYSETRNGPQRCTSVKTRSASMP
jgi:RNA polymerase sigma factor (sigma-70 family)